MSFVYWGHQPTQKRTISWNSGILSVASPTVSHKQAASTSLANCFLDILNCLVFELNSEWESIDQCRIKVRKLLGSFKNIVDGRLIEVYLPGFCTFIGKTMWQLGLAHNFWWLCCRLIEYLSPPIGSRTIHVLRGWGGQMLMLSDGGQLRVIREVRNTVASSMCSHDICNRSVFFFLSNLRLEYILSYRM